MAENKRRLPVLQASSPSPADGADDESRPEWQWIGFGIVAMFAAWLPLAAAAGMLARRAAEAALGAPLDEASTREQLGALSDAARQKLIVAYVAPHVVALALAGVFAGFVIGKFGQGGGRAASVAAGAVCVVAGLLAVRDLSSLVALVAVLLVAVLAARAGAAWGARRRKE